MATNTPTITKDSRMAQYELVRVVNPIRLLKILII